MAIHFLCRQLAHLSLTARVFATPCTYSVCVISGQNNIDTALISHIYNIDYCFRMQERVPQHVLTCKITFLDPASPSFAWNVIYNILVDLLMQACWTSLSSAVFCLDPQQLDLVNSLREKYTDIKFLMSRVEHPLDSPSASSNCLFVMSTL